MFIVDDYGDVACAEVVSGLPSGLTDVALGAITRSKFEPAVWDGVPVAIRMTLPITFRLRQ